MRLVRVAGLALILASVVASASAAGWTRCPDVTGLPSGKQVKGGGGIAAVEDVVYLIPGDNTLDFMKYDGVAWAPIVPGVPEGAKKKRVKKGAWLVSADNKVYVFKGGGTNEFYQYDPSTNTWATLVGPGFTKGVKGGFATVVSLAGTKYIYAGSGSNTSEWKRFNLSTLAWEAASPASLPVEKAKVGSCLVTDETGVVYFLLGNGSNVNSFYAADLNQVTPAWAPKTPLPMTVPGGKGKKKVKEGGCIENLGGTFYAVKGGSTTQFWSYLPATDAWTYVGEVGDGGATKGIKCGKSLATGKTGVFAIIGNNTPGFWYYSPVFNMGHGSDPAAMTGAVAPRATHMRLTPNPARAGAGVACALPEAQVATFEVRNTLGQVVATATSQDGRFLIQDLVPGVYTLSVEAPGFQEQEKLVVLK